MPSKILLVDDEPDLLTTLQFRLEQQGYVVETATDGAQALQAALSGNPDLIVLDVMLPGENGYRVAQAVRAEEDKSGVGNVPIILLTARDLSSEPDREKMFMDFSRANLMMYKPFDINELLQQIEKLLRPGNGASPSDLGVS